MKSLPHTTDSLYTADDVKLIERQSCLDEGVSLFELMQRAGLAAWQSLQQQFPEAETILIIAGAGNNAGDGFILACHAHQHGKTVKVLTVKSEPSYQGDAALAFELLQQTDIELSLIHISEPTRRTIPSRMPSSA